MNPYTGAGFFEFFWILAKRLCQFIGGEPTLLVSDEIQLIVLGCSAIACGLLGPFLVLKRISMFANSLSHTALLGIVVAFLFASHIWGSRVTDLTTLLLGAGIAALMTAALTELLSRLFRLSADASIGISFTLLFALGVLLVSLFTKDAHVSTEAVLGNCDALQLSDVRFAGSIALCNLIALCLFFRPFSLISFDEPFLRALGFSAPFWRFCLFFLTALTVIGSFRAVGVLVVLVELTGPYLMVRLFCHRLNRLVIWTPLCALFIAFLSVALSRAVLSWTGIALSTGGILTLVTAILFLGAALWRSLSYAQSPAAKPKAVDSL